MPRDPRAEPCPAGRLAFNKGSDARLMGVPLDLSPYHPVDDEALWHHWVRGWQDVEHGWGLLARHKFRVKPLRPVREMN